MLYRLAYSLGLIRGIFLIQVPSQMPLACFKLIKLAGTGLLFCNQIRYLWRCHLTFLHPQELQSRLVAQESPVAQLLLRLQCRGPWPGFPHLLPVFTRPLYANLVICKDRELLAPLPFLRNMTINSAAKIFMATRREYKDLRIPGR